jgi:hypothetical protein
MRSASLIAVASVLLGVLLPASAAQAARYGGWADTGWAHYDKSECCEDAIIGAQEDSMDRCEWAGGSPNARFGTRRGSCRWHWRTDAWGQRVYRCTSSAKVHCR